MALDWGERGVSVPTASIITEHRKKYLFFGAVSLDMDENNRRSGRVSQRMNISAMVWQVDEVSSFAIYLDGLSAKDGDAGNSG